MTPGGQEYERFLAQFDGDVERAIAALRQYANTHAPKAPATPVRPTRPSHPATGPIIMSMQHVHKTYKLGRQSITALDDVTLDIYEGELVALTGASGSGKSTLLQLLGGLDKPTKGEVIIHGQSLRRLSDRKLSAFRGRTIGFVFQSFYLQPFLTLATNLEIPAMFARMKPSERHQRAGELATLVGLDDRMKHLPKELSGGQMQRAAIARALFNQPKILLADEPTGNLDSTNSQRIIALFQKIRAELGTTIVIVTHNPEIAALADREIILKDGRII